MSSIDERVVVLEFNNSQFESGVKQSVTSLEKLKSALQLEESADGLAKLEATGKSFSMNNVADNVQKVADRFSVLGIVGDQVLRRLTNSAIDFGKAFLFAVPNQLVSGGKKRAQNIEHAKFMLEGLLKENYDWNKIKDDLSYGVQDTAYGLDEAAKAAAQLAASNVSFGDEMKTALRAISGVASMTNQEYEVITDVFTAVAGQGKVTRQELNRLAHHGINAAATIAHHFDVTEQQVYEAARKGEIDFAMFAEAMDAEFGEHAKNANATFTGALSNVKASLSRMGEGFATPGYEALKDILNALLPVLKNLEQVIKPLSSSFAVLAQTVSGAVCDALAAFNTWLSLFVPGAKTAVNVTEQLKGRFDGVAESIAYGAHSMWSSVFNPEPFEHTFKTIDGSFDAFMTKAKAVKKYEETIEDLSRATANSILSLRKNLPKQDITMRDEAMVKYYEDLEKTSNNAVKNAFKATAKYLSKGEDAQEMAELLGGALSNVNTYLSEANRMLIGIGEDSDEVFDAFQYKEGDTWTIFDQMGKDWEHFKNVVKVGGDPFEEIIKEFTGSLLDYDEVLNSIKNSDQAPFLSQQQMEEMANTRLMDKLSAAYTTAVGKMNLAEKALVDSGQSEKTANELKQAGLDNLTDSVTNYVVTREKADKKESFAQKYQKKKRELYDKTRGALDNMAHSFLQMIGLEQDMSKYSTDSANGQAKLQELAEQVINGDYGNGEERIKKLKELTGVYSIVQNKVNELLDCQKRHAVTEEDEAAWAAYLGEVYGEDSKQAQIVSEVLDKIATVISTIWAALSLVKDVAVSLWTEMLLPFLQWSIPRVLHAILTPLSFIGNKILDLWATFQVFKESGGLALFFENIRNKVSDFWNKVQELEGVKAITKAWEDFKTTMAGLADDAIKKVNDGIDYLREHFHLPESQTFLSIIDTISSALSTLVGWLTIAADIIGGALGVAFDWLISIPVQIQGFWESLGGFEGVKTSFNEFIDSIGPLKAIKDVMLDLFNSDVAVNIRKLGSAFGNFFSTIFFGKKDKKGTPKKLEGTLNTFEIFLERLKKGFKELKKNVKEAFGDVIESLGGALGSRLTWLRDKFLGFVDSVPILKSIKDTLLEIFNEDFINTIKSVGEAIGNFFVTIFENIKKAIGDFFGNLFGGNKEKSGITGMAEKQLNSAKEKIDAAKEMLFGKDSKTGKFTVLENIREAFFNMAGSIGETVGPKIDELKQKLLSFIDSVPILKGIKNVLGSIFNANLLTSLTKIKDAFGNFFSTIFDSEDPRPILEKLKTAFVSLFQELTGILGSEEGSGLLKLLITGSILSKFGLLAKLISLITGRNKGDEEGVAGAIFGSASGGPGKIIAGILGIIGALQLYENSLSGVKDENGMTGNFIVDTWIGIKQKIFELLGVIQAQDIPGKIYATLFGVKNESGQKIKTGIIDNVIQTVSNIIGTIAKAVSGIFDKNKSILGVGKAGGLIVAFLGIYGVFVIIQKVMVLAKAIGSGLFGFAGLMTDIRMALSAWETSIRANTLLTIAKSIGIFAASIALLTFVDPERLAAVGILVTWLTALIGGFMIANSVITTKNLANMAAGLTTFSNGVVVAMRQLSMAVQFGTTLAGVGIAFIGLAYAIKTIVDAMKLISDNPPAQGAMLAVLGIIATIFAALMSIGWKAIQLQGVAASLIGIGVAMYLVVQAVVLAAKAAANNGDTFWAGYGAMLLMMAFLMIFIGVTSTLKGAAGVTTAAVSLLALAGAMLIFAMACVVLQVVNWEQIGKGLLVFIGGLVALGILMQAGAFGMFTGGGPALAILALAAAMLVLAPALILLGLAWPSAAKGIIVLAAAIVAFGFALRAIPPDITRKFKIIGTGMIRLALAAAILAVAIPMLARGIVTAAQIAIQNIGYFVLGAGMLAGALYGLAKVSLITGPELLKLALAVLALGVGITLITGALTGFRGLRDLFADIGGVTKASTPSLRTAAEAMGDLSMKSSEMFKNMGNKSSLDKYKNAVNQLDYLTDEAKNHLGQSMEEISKLSGGDLSKGLDDVLAYIRSLNLDQSATDQAFNMTVQASLDIAKEKFTGEVEGLKVAVKGVKWRDSQAEQEFWGLVEDLVNSGANPQGDQLDQEMENLEQTTREFAKGLGLSDNMTELLVAAVRDAAIAFSKKQLAGITLDATISNLHISEESKANLDRDIQTYLNSNSFDGHIAEVKTALDNVKPYMPTAEWMMLRTQVSNLVTTAAGYNFKLANIRLAFGGLADGYDIYTAVIEPAIREAGINIANGSMSEEEAMKNLEIKIRTTLSAATDENGKPVGEQFIDDIVQQAKEAAKDREVAELTVKSITAAADKYDIDPAAKTELSTKLNELLNDPTNPMEIEKLYLKAKEYDLTGAEMSQLFGDLEKQVQAQAESSMMMHYMTKAFEDNEIQMPEDQQNQLYELIAKINKEGLNESSLEYQQAKQLLLNNSFNADGTFNLKAYNEAVEQLNKTLEAGGDVLTVEIKEIELLIDNATFSSEAEKASWQDRVKELWKTKEDKPLDLPVTVDKFLTDLTASSIDTGSEEKINKVVESMFKIWNEAYDQQYAETLKKIQFLQYEEMGNAGAVDQQTGTYIKKGGKLFKAMEEFWKDGSHNIESAKDWREFAESLYYDYRLNQNDFLNELGNPEDPQQLLSMIYDSFPLGPMERGSGEMMMNILGGLAYSIQTGTDAAMRSYARSSEKYDFVGMLLGLAGLDPENLTEKDYEYYERIADNIIRGIETSDLGDTIRRALGKSFGDKITLSDIYSYLFDENPTYDQTKYGSPMKHRLEYTSFLQNDSSGFNLMDLWDAIKKAKEEALEKNEPFDPYEYIAELVQPYRVEFEFSFEPSTEGGKEKPIPTLNEAVEEFLKESPEDFDIKPEEIEGKTQEYINTLAQAFNPEGLDVENGDYYAWLKSVIDSWGLTDPNGNPWDMDYIMKQMIYSITQGKEIDPVQFIANLLHEAMGNGTYNKNMLWRVFKELYPEFIDAENSKENKDENGNYKFGTENPRGENGEVIESPLRFRLRVGEAQQLEEDEQAYEEAYKEMYDGAVEAANEAAQQGDFSVWNSILENSELDESQLKESMQGADFTSVFSGMGDTGLGNAFNQFVNGQLDLDGLTSMLNGSLSGAGGGAVEGLATEFGSSPFWATAEGNLTAGLTNLTNVPNSVFDMHSPSHVFESKAESCIEGLANGYERFKPALNALKDALTSLVDAASEYSSRFLTPGVDAISSYASGITSAVSFGVSAVISLVEQCISSLRTNEDRVKEAGQFFAQGYAEGIRDKISEVQKAAEELGNAGTKTLENVEKIQSPSKVSMGLGRFFGMGYVIGMRQFIDKAGAAAADMAKSSTDALVTPMSIIQDILDSDMDADPVISPVMDLSGIQNGVRRINGMMPDAGIRLNAINSAMNRPKTTNADVVSAIASLSKDMPTSIGDTYNINGITYDDGTNVSNAVQSLVRAARVERRR